MAGIVMAIAMMGYMALTGVSVWTNPNLIAVMWLGDGAANATFSTATIIGLATHMATSALMGVIALPFLRDLPLWQTLLAGSAYALSSYPFAFAFVLTWANPLMIERTALIPMTLAHVLFGLVLGGVYFSALRRGSDSAIHLARPA